MYLLLQLEKSQLALFPLPDHVKQDTQGLPLFTQLDGLLHQRKHICLASLFITIAVEVSLWESLQQKKRHVWNKRHEQTEAAAHIKSGQKRPGASGALLDPIVINAADNVRLELEGDENLPKALCYSRAGHTRSGERAYLLYGHRFPDGLRLQHNLLRATLKGER